MAQHLDLPVTASRDDIERTLWEQGKSRKQMEEALRETLPLAEMAGDGALVRKLRQALTQGTENKEVKDEEK